MVSSTLLVPVRGLSTSMARTMAARAHKRFYDSVSVVQSNDDDGSGGGAGFEICLDQRKLKTPLGRPLRLSQEPLAQAVAQEWAAQEKIVMTQQMHLTGLCNATVDNPTGASREDLVDAVLNFLQTDTVLFFSSADENELLLRRQEELWQPVIDWFCRRHGVSLEPSKDFSVPNFSPGCRETIRKHLLSYDLPCLHGFSFGADATKSFLLTSATMERELTVQDAVRLARLELQFQTERWGSVEWSHDLELHDTTARLAAATLFVHLSSSQHFSKKKASSV